MKKFLSRHKETLLVALIGFVIIVALNVMMLQYHYAPWTNPKVGFWSAFWNRFEISGFDPYTYIVVSKWRTLYVLSALCPFASSVACGNDVAVVEAKWLADGGDGHELCNLHSWWIARGVQSVGMAADVQDNASVAEYVGKD